MATSGPPAGPPAPDDELLRRQDALQAEAAGLLPDLARCLAPLPLLPTGSYVSGLMCWRDLDVMALVGAGFEPRDVLRLLDRCVDLPGLVGFEYHDERGPRSPTGERRDERYHVPLRVGAADAPWRIDLTLWLHDPHHNVTAWHENLRGRVTAEQRLAILRIKDAWHRLPDYPDQVGGTDIYAAVLDAGVRTPAAFADWLRERADGSRSPAS